MAAPARGPPAVPAAAEQEVVMRARLMLGILGVSVLALGPMGCSTGRARSGNAPGSGGDTRPAAPPSDTAPRGPAVTQPVTPPAMFEQAGWKTDQPAVDPRPWTENPPVAPSAAVRPPARPPARPSGELPGSQVPPAGTIADTPVLPPPPPADSVSLPPKADPARKPPKKKDPTSGGLGPPPGG